MKRIIATIISIAVLFSIAVPVTVNAASKVTNVRQIDAGNTSVTVTWDAVLGASKYKVEVSERQNGGYVIDNNYALNQEYIINLSAAKTYYVKVTAYINNKYDSSTTSTPIKVCTAPYKVQNLRQVNCTTSSVSLAWSQSAGASYYVIYGRVNSTNYVLAKTRGTSYTLKGFKNNQDFKYDLFVQPVRNEGNYEAGMDTPWYSCAGIDDYKINLTPKKSAVPKLTGVYDSIGVVYFDTPSVPYGDGRQTAIYKTNKKKVYTSGEGYRFENLKKGQFYKAKRRYYTKVGDNKTVKKIYGSWSGYRYFTLGCKSVSAKSYKKSIKVSWGKVKGGKKIKYDIYVSRFRNKGLKKYKTNVKGTSIKVTKYGKKKLSRKTGYYTYIIPKIKVGKKTYKSPVYSYVYTYTR